MVGTILPACEGHSEMPSNSGGGLTETPVVAVEETSRLKIAAAVNLIIAKCG